MKLFEGIDPTDINQGKIANCYFLAALAGLAEDPIDKSDRETMKAMSNPKSGYERNNIGIRVRDNFLTKTVNEAGCYALLFNVAGEDVEVVVDEWFPFYVDSKGVERFCFAQVRAKYNEQTRNQVEEPELWVMLMEKAWAKICGSYEQAELGTAAEAFNNIDGTPVEVNFVKDYEKDNNYGLLWEKMQNADLNCYPMTCTIDSNVRGLPKNIDKFGLKDFHSYTVL